MLWHRKGRCYAVKRQAGAGRRRAESGSVSEQVAAMCQHSYVQQRHLFQAIKVFIVAVQVP